jgi:hypothetical protein
MEHPWFRAGLPPAALTMNVELVRQQAAQANPVAGEQVCARRAYWDARLTRAQVR